MHNAASADDADVREDGPGAVADVVPEAALVYAALEAASALHDVLCTMLVDLAFEGAQDVGQEHGLAAVEPQVLPGAAHGGAEVFPVGAPLT